MQKGLAGEAAGPRLRLEGGERLATPITARPRRVRQGVLQAREYGRRAPNLTTDAVNSLGQPMIQKQIPLQLSGPLPEFLRVACQL